MDHAWLLLLRLVHVLGGMFWMGSMVMMAGFVLPTQALEGHDGGRFIQRMMTERRLSFWLNVVGGLAIVSGLILYTRATMGTGGAFARSRQGMVFGLGAVFAILAGAIGGAMGSRSARAAGVLRARIAAERRAPTPEELSELGNIGARGARGARIAATLLVLSAAAMAVARYA
jgi:hypothetical protein